MYITIKYIHFLLFLLSLPEDMAFLRNLTKLYVYKNFIEELPEVCKVRVSFIIKLSDNKLFVKRIMHILIILSEIWNISALAEFLYANKIAPVHRENGIYIVFKKKIIRMSAHLLQIAPEKIIILLFFC